MSKTAREILKVLIDDTDAPLTEIGANDIDLALAQLRELVEENMPPICKSHSPNCTISKIVGTTTDIPRCSCGLEGWNCCAEECKRISNLVR